MEFRNTKDTNRALWYKLSILVITIMGDSNILSVHFFMNESFQASTLKNKHNYVVYNIVHWETTEE